MASRMRIRSASTSLANRQSNVVSRFAELNPSGFESSVALPGIANTRQSSNFLRHAYTARAQLARLRPKLIDELVVFGLGYRSLVIAGLPEALSNLRVSPTSHHPTVFPTHASAQHAAFSRDDIPVI